MKILHKSIWSQKEGINQILVFFPYVVKFPESCCLFFFFFVLLCKKMLNNIIYLQ